MNYNDGNSNSEPTKHKFNSKYETFESKNKFKISILIEKSTNYIVYN